MLPTVRASDLEAVGGGEEQDVEKMAAAITSGAFVIEVAEQRSISLPYAGGSHGAFSNRKMSMKSVPLDRWESGIGE